MSELPQFAEIPTRELRRLQLSARHLLWRAADAIEDSLFFHRAAPGVGPDWLIERIMRPYRRICRAVYWYDFRVLGYQFFSNLVAAVGSPISVEGSRFSSCTALSFNLLRSYRFVAEAAETNYADGERLSDGTGRELQIALQRLLESTAWSMFGTENWHNERENLDALLLHEENRLLDMINARHGAPKAQNPAIMSGQVGKNEVTILRRLAKMRTALLYSDFEDPNHHTSMHRDTAAKYGKKLIQLGFVELVGPRSGMKITEKGVRFLNQLGDDD